MASNDSCTQWEGQNLCLSTNELGEDQAVNSEEKREPTIVAIYNGKELDIREELIKGALSGISIKHYDGNCLPSGEPISDGLLFGEDYSAFEFEAEEEEEEMKKNPSKTMSSMIRLCYEPKSRGLVIPEDGAEELSDFVEKPLCLQDPINFRNSFWDLHRPDLCKLTWPHVYVGAAIVTQHLHRHIRNHGKVCSDFHDPLDMIAMLNKELDLYDKLKTVQSPREIPPDEELIYRSAGIGRKSRKMKFDPCKKPIIRPPPARLDNDDDLEPSQVIHPSKEEFCITIGRPTRRRAIGDVQSEKSSESKQMWLPQDEREYEEFEDYIYPENSNYSTISCEMGEYVSEELNEEEENFAEEESTPPEPARWTEPDFCAMI